MYLPFAECIIAREDFIVEYRHNKALKNDACAVVRLGSGLLGHLVTSLVAAPGARLSFIVSLQYTKPKMINLLLAWIRKIISDTHNVVVGAVLMLVFGGSSFATLAFPNKVQEMLISTPQVWLLIAMSFGSLLISLILIKFLPTINKTKNKDYYPLINACGYKWRVSHSAGLVVHIDPIPHCPKHDLELTEENNFMSCHRKGCETKIIWKEFDIIFPHVRSEIKKAVREL